MSNTSSILFEEIEGRERNLGLITLNRPQVLNALNHEMVISLHQKLLEWENANNIKAVIIRAAEGRAFCAGGDLRLVYAKHTVNDPSLPSFFCDEYRLNHYIFHYSKPYIAFLDGITMGGGAGISLHGSHRIGTERLLFAMPETGIGFFPDIGGTYFLSRLSKRIGLYVGLTGARLSCDDCLETKLIDYKIAKENISQIIKEFADSSFSENPYDTINKIIKKFHQPAKISTLAAYEQLISHHFSKQTLEDILDSLKSDSSPWCQETVAILSKKSPISLKVTLRQLQEGLKRDFDQCMQQEYHLMCHFLQGHDFFEGIRATVIDKDQNPHWQPSELKAITDQMIEAYFTPLIGNAAELIFN